MIQIFRRVVIQEFSAIQYDGTNLKEVYDFFCKHHANANDRTFEELQEEPYNKRPSQIPLDIEGGPFVDKMWADWKARNKTALEALHASHSTNDAAFLTPEAIEERKLIHSLDWDWRKGEEYHFYVSTPGDRCRMIGVCKGDWFYMRGGYVEVDSGAAFKTYLEDNGYKLYEGKEEC